MGNMEKYQVVVYKVGWKEKKTLKMLLLFKAATTYLVMNIFTQ